MDNKNVFVAIALSMSVLLFWGAFFETPKQVDTKDSLEQIENESKDVDEESSEDDQSQRMIDMPFNLFDD